MVALDELRAQDVALVAHHVVVLLLLGLLLLGRLDDLLHVVDVVLLVLDHLFIRLDLRLCAVLVGLDLHVFSLDLLVVLVEFHQFLVLVLDFFAELVDGVGHALVLLLEFVDLILGLDEVLGVEVAVASNRLVEVLLVLALVLDLLVLLLQVLNLRVLDLELLERLVVLGVGVGGLDAVFLLLLLDLLEDAG